MKEHNRRQFLRYAAAAGVALANIPLSVVSARAEPERKDSVKVRAVLAHVTHYDPSFNRNKESEEPFDLEVGLELVETMAAHGLNTLVMDIEDGVIYESHPELQRHYSVPMKDLELLAETARGNNIDFVPKCNFSKSGRNHHDMWMKPHWRETGWTWKMDEYWQVAGDVIDELVSVCKPRKYFHIGMDEDHYRSVSQYVEAIKILHGKIGKHGLKAAMWNDTCYLDRNVVAQVYADKTIAAEPLIPRDMVQLVWDYDLVHEGIVKRLTDQGFEAWVAPGGNLERIARWKKILLAEGGNGLLMSNWVKCSRRNRDRIVSMITEQAPVYSG